MKYSEEQLQKFAKMHGTQLTKEEVEAVWEWLAVKRREKLQKVSHFKNEYPELTEDDIFDIADENITLEEALGRHM